MRVIAWEHVVVKTVMDDDESGLDEQLAIPTFRREAKRHQEIVNPECGSKGAASSPPGSTLSSMSFIELTTPYGENIDRSNSGHLELISILGERSPDKHGGLSPNDAANGVQTSHSSADRNDPAVPDISTFRRRACSWHEHASDIGTDAKPSGCSASADVVQQPCCAAGEHTCSPDEGHSEAR